MQKQYRDPLLTVITLLLLVLLFVLALLAATGIVVFHAFSALLVAFCMNVVAVVLRVQAPSIIDIYLVAGAWLILTGTLGWVVSRAVFAPGRVNYHRIVGAVLLYMLIGMIFVSLYVFIGLLSPKSFAGIAVEDNTRLASNLIYFSFVTLTSTGYGDILPLHPVARSLCNLESIIGQLYPATLLAKLVTLELNDRR